MQRRVDIDESSAKANHDGAIRIGRDEGMQLFNDSLYDFVDREFISREAAFEISPNIEELKMRLKGIEVKGPSIL